MADREKVITDLKIIQTWAEFALERDINFFTELHMRDLINWTDDAILLIKELYEYIDELRHAPSYVQLMPRDIVMCKDCKKCDLPEEEPYENGYCSRCGYVTMNWFCADGVEKDE